MIDFQRTLGVLVSAGIEFIIVGGAAATAHGSVRLTLDLDVVYSRQKENIKRLVEALRPFHPKLRGAPENPVRWDEETVTKGLNFTLTTSLGWLDLLGEIPSGGSYEELVSDSIRINVLGYDCLCLGLRRLIEIKRAAGRHKDLEAIAELQVILEEQSR
jgi:predicted nucleotidyltransferase